MKRILILIALIGSAITYGQSYNYTIYKISTCYMEESGNLAGCVDYEYDGLITVSEDLNELVVKTGDIKGQYYTIDISLEDAGDGTNDLTITANHVAGRRTLFYFQKDDFIYMYYNKNDKTEVVVFFIGSFFRR